LLSSKTPTSLAAEKRRRKLDEEFLAEIDPQNLLPPTEREAKLRERRKRHFSELAKLHLANSNELQYLIKLTALAIARQVKADATERRKGGGDV
jgi:hypothetical protein